jgi:hypothetical protein
MSSSDVRMLIVRLERAGDPRRTVTTEERQDCCRRAHDVLSAVRDLGLLDASTLERT